MVQQNGLKSFAGDFAAGDEFGRGLLDCGIFRCQSAHVLLLFSMVEGYDDQAFSFDFRKIPYNQLRVHVVLFLPCCRAALFFP